jgi:hypothetical protein
MNSAKQCSLITVLAAGVIGLAQAQTPAPGGAATSPGGSSSHPGAASTPHQHEPMGTDGEKGMKMAADVREESRAGRDDRS